MWKAPSGAFFWFLLGIKKVYRKCINHNKYGNKKWRVALLRVNRKCICERISNVEKLRDIWIICQMKKNCCCWTEHFAYMENYTLHHKFKKLCYPINWRWNNAENFNC